MSRFDKDDRAGIYITVIFHLAVIIVLLLTQIGFSISKENSFVLDFTRQEQVEKEKKEVDFKEDVSKRIEQMLTDAGHSPVRNVAVDRSALKDDRGTDADQLYKDAERLRQELGHHEISKPSKDEVYEYKPEPASSNSSSKSTYGGPSVVSYELDGRKASRLSIPAYRCMGAGLVTVIISVDNQGSVVNAKVQDDVSSSDSCLRNFAVRAARLSKFSTSPSAPPRQIGNIVYQFIAQ